VQQIHLQLIERFHTGKRAFDGVRQAQAACQQRWLIGDRQQSVAATIAHAISNMTGTLLI